MSDHGPIRHRAASAKSLRHGLLAPWLLAIAVLATAADAPPPVFPRAFGALEGKVAAVERPARDEVCLNGLWRFQPVSVPQGWKRDQGEAPPLPPPTGTWEQVPIRIPSPWNVNGHGCGRHVGAGTPHPYWPDSVTFPSYPPHWDGVEMGWLGRSFRLPAAWRDKRVLLRFDAVAGDCQVLVNGTAAGGHFDRFLPFTLDITALVRRDGDNELAVGVRASRLFNKTHPRYPHHRSMYAPGSNLDGITGIWQDVTLLAVPAVHTAEVFVQPWVDQDELRVEATVRNDTDLPQDVTLAGTVKTWINQAGSGVLDAPEPKWSLGATVLTVPPARIQLAAGAKATVILKATVGGKLKTWTPDAPNLHGLVLTASVGGVAIDTRYQRFGWRQFRIKGQDLTLNGTKFQVMADILHPFGVFAYTRRHAWAWYTMIKDVGGNGVRLHAQPWPAYYLDLADEMGLAVLDETGLFGSSLGLNFVEPLAWERYAQHYDELVLRDRNHPSVFGWSFGNELFAIFDYNHMTKEDTDAAYAKLADLGRRAFALDPTRDWISSDGDADLRGTMPVWAKHFGHGLPLDKLPGLNKPLMVGESGGTYYAKPGQMAAFNGDRAYQDYAGRNEALAIDVYQNIVRMARPRLAYYCASELSWFGIEHLGIGHRDLTRLPTLADGIFFGPFVDGRPGMQPERLAPWATTFNPGYDPALPVYRPLAMFDAMKAALAKDGPRPCPWDHQPAHTNRPRASATAAITSVGFVGNRSGRLFRTLSDIGLPFAADGTDTSFVIIDGSTLTTAQADAAKARCDALVTRGGTALVCFRDADADMAATNRLLPAPIALTNRTATALTHGADHPWAAPFALADLYFAENDVDRRVQKCGIGGAFATQGAVVLKASDTDWSQFNHVGEAAKCAATVLHERLVKPAGGALVALKRGAGIWAACAIDWQPGERSYVRLWRSILWNMGVRMGEPRCAWHSPVAPVQTAVWRYTTDDPGAGWERPGFADGAWKQGEAGFGTDVPASRVRTPWHTNGIWLRRSFDRVADATGDLTLVVHHDEDLAVFLNGERIFQAEGHLSAYKEVPLTNAQAQLLKPTGNILAVHCRQTAGGQYIDVGLAQGLVLMGSGASRGHDLLLNGPKD